MDILGIDLIYISLSYFHFFQIELAFNRSSLSNSFGDVVISDINELSESTVLLKLVINFQSDVTEQDIIQGFLSQLTGSSGGQLPPDHRLVRRTFIIGDPSKHLF